MTEEIEMIIDELKEGMDSTISSLSKSLQSIRTGVAHASLLDHVKVDYYGSLTPISQIAAISVPEARVILIKPWEKPMVKEVEKAIMTSDIGINPMNEGEQIRLVIPQPTVESRRELAKKVKKLCEDSKVSLRNVRRNTMDALKKAKDEYKISEDIIKDTETEVQSLIKSQETHIDQIFSNKEKEIMTV